MAWYTDAVLPRLVDIALRRPPFTSIRARGAAGLAGEVVEIGFGSGLNVPYYPPPVHRVLAVDPARAGREMAAKRVARSPVPVEYVGLDSEDLPVASASVDHVLCTWSLCTIPDPARALAEVRRVLRPGGGFHFAEHGLAPDATVARWQRRLTPLQRRLAGGCHLDRPIDELVEGAGLALDGLSTYYVEGPRPYCFMYEGTATRT